MVLRDPDAMGVQSDADDDFELSESPPSYAAHWSQSRPLIYSARNARQSRPGGSYNAASRSLDDTKPPRWIEMTRSVVSAPRFRRYVLIYLGLFLVGWVSWRMLLYPRLQERSSLLHSLDPSTKTEAGGWFGSNAMPQFDDIVHIRTLDPELVPSGSAEVEADSSSRKRLIFVGDVHGCKAELEELLEKVSFKPNSGDHLILTGDLINKGPDSTGVVDLARGYSASCVRGNHEDRILLVRQELVKTNALATPEDDEESYLSSRETRERALARSLSDEQAKWLSSCPVILDVGPVPGIGQVVVVHAGLVPGVELEKQDPSSVMTMRTIDLDTHVPSPKKKGMNWAKMFDKHQSLLYSNLESSIEDRLSGTMTVVYGHDASSSLSIRTFTKGLDSGCVKGGKLTALVVEDGGKQNIVKVKCKDYLKEK
ncbi:hypothetical protein N7522_007223 [Penicillium canescens]|uniref:Calcineurin-like phosphoesterase domain-containing protein n=1 Tax=Penicillium canescens TaxID=5083 RepID=A0AAD6I7Y3_PENCN|nr:uncharacterized protein N7446_009677 [Penicillium canescens]KAJ6001996.1 hypothetical protein N7522_007223 [Penicillium canescens]KAJ6034920.1 hypothetical protein N7460_009095 [Penicillium canescens]KAJ6046583.1 hypothetical protein N7444_007837 [Penicillium canescens]KAJ6053665.1 hypothetical protein N7446_009677 [Penicillium canescens]